MRRQGNHGIQTNSRGIYIYIYVCVCKIYIYIYIYIFHISVAQPIFSSRDCSSVIETGLTSIYFWRGCTIERPKET